MKKPRFTIQQKVYCVFLTGYTFIPCSECNETKLVQYTNKKNIITYINCPECHGEGKLEAGKRYDYKKGKIIGILANPDGTFSYFVLINLSEYKEKECDIFKTKKWAKLRAEQLTKNDIRRANEK